MTQAHARSTDPHTSHEAAATVKNITMTQTYILGILATPMTDEHLVNTYKDLARLDPVMPWASESGIRSRRAELAKLGMVQIVGHEYTRANRKTHVWQTTKGTN
jgi:hypothetical protein